MNQLYERSLQVLQHRDIKLPTAHNDKLFQALIFNGKLVISISMPFKL
jgi:hypothetical protein